jgi:hypothetical protein
MRNKFPSHKEFLIEKWSVKMRNDKFMRRGELIKLSKAWR